MAISGFSAFSTEKGSKSGQGVMGHFCEIRVFRASKLLQTSSNQRKTDLGKIQSFRKKYFFRGFRRGFACICRARFRDEQAEIPLFSGSFFAIWSEKSQKRAFWPKSTRFFESVCQNDLNRRKKLSKKPKCVEKALNQRSLIPLQNTQKPDFGFSRDKTGRRPAT